MVLRERLGTASRRGFLAGLLGAATVAVARPLRLTRTNAAPAAPITPSSLWSSGVAGSGFDVTGVSAFQEPTTSPKRNYLAAARPAMRPCFHNRMTVDGDYIVGVNADFDGLPGSPQGVQLCRLHLEGKRYDATSKTTRTFTDSAGVTRTHVLYHFTIDFAATMAICATGTAKFYIECIANDPAMDSQISQPYYFSPRSGLLPAPWDLSGPAIYDGVYPVDKNLSVSGGGVYKTTAEATQAALNAGKKSPLISWMRNGAHPMGAVTGGVRTPTQLFTYAADPRTVTTSAWAGDGTGSGITFGQGGIRLLGLKTQINICQLGLGYSVMSGLAGGGADQALVVDCAEITHGATPAGVAGWTGTGGAALYNGAGPSQTWLGQHWAEVSFGGCDIHDASYGIVAGTGSWLTVAWDTDLHKCFKVGNLMGAYKVSHYETGAYNHPLAPPVDAFDWWYSGASTHGYVMKYGPTGQNGVLSLFESANTVTLAAQAIGSVNGSGQVTVTANSLGSDLSGHYLSNANVELLLTDIDTDNGGGNGIYNVTCHSTVKVPAITAGTYMWDTASISILSATTTWPAFQAFFSGVSGFNSTMLAVTADTQRILGALWIGTYPTTPASQGIPLTQLGTSGAKTRSATKFDIHCDAFNWTGTNSGDGSTNGANVFQNVIFDQISIYGKKSGQTTFFNGAAGWADFYIKNFESHDDSGALGAGFTGFATIAANNASNLVMKAITVAGAQDSLALLSGTIRFIGDALCKFQDMFQEASLFKSTSTSPVADVSLMQIDGVFSRTSTTATITDAHGGVLTGIPADGGIFVDTTGVAPYGYGGAGTPPNLTPANSTVLLEPVTGRICGSRNLDGTRKAA